MWKSGFHPTDTGKNGPRRLLEYMGSAVWECCKSCPDFPILEDFSRKMGSGVVFHRISKGESGGIFPQSGCFSDPAPVKNRLFQIVETGDFQNRKSRTRKAAFPYKGNISTKYPRKTNRFPQCIPHTVEKLGRNEGFRRPFLQKGSAPPKNFEKKDHLLKFWSTFFQKVVGQGQRPCIGISFC